LESSWSNNLVLLLFFIHKNCSFKLEKVQLWHSYLGMPKRLIEIFYFKKFTKKLGRLKINFYNARQPEQKEKP